GGGKGGGGAGDKGEGQVGREEGAEGSGLAHRHALALAPDVSGRRRGLSPAARDGGTRVACGHNGVNNGLDGGIVSAWPGSSRRSERAFPTGRSPTSIPAAVGGCQSTTRRTYGM